MLPILEVLRWCVGAVVVNDEVVEHLRHGRQASYDVMGKESDQVLFLNQAATVAVLAYPVADDAPTHYQPEKVFHLNEG